MAKTAHGVHYDELIDEYQIDWDFIQQKADEWDEMPGGDVTASTFIDWLWGVCEEKL